MSKRILKLAALIAAVAVAVITPFALSACNNGGEGEGGASDKTPVSSWVGSYTRNGSMGNMVYGHMVNFYDDDTVTVYWAMYAGATGLYFGSYSGTYEDGTVTYTYNKLESEEVGEASFDVDLNSTYFQAKIFCGATTPSENFSYVQIPPVQPDKNADYIYMGSYVSGSSVNGAYIEVSGTSFKASVSYKGAKGIITGASRVDESSWEDVDTPDYLCLTYNALNVSSTQVKAEGEEVESKFAFNTTTYLTFSLQKSDGTATTSITCAALKSDEGTQS